MTIKKYTAKLNSDTGLFNLTVFATSLSNAIKMICNTQNCPRNAIKSITSKNI